MYPEPLEDVIDEQLVYLVGKAKRWHHHISKTGNRGIVYSHKAVFQIANSWSVGVVGDRVQRAVRQIKKQNVVGLVEKGNRIAFQVMDTGLARPDVVDRHELPVLPVYSIGVIAQGQSHEKRVFPLKGPAQPRHRVIASRFCDGHVSRPQCARNDRMRLLGS